MASPAPPRPLVVGVSGASCSGKTWLAQLIHSRQPTEAELIDLDGYYRDLPAVQLLEFGHDNPDSVDGLRAAADLLRLKQGESIDLPLYDYEFHRAFGSRPCHPQALIIVEGLFAFAYRPLRDLFDLKIWIEAGESSRMTRRITRDTARRQRSVEEIQERYARDVLPGYHKFIHPLRDHADVIVDNDGRGTDQVHESVQALLDQIRCLLAANR